MNPPLEKVPAEYSKTTRRNRSLTPRGRVVFLALAASHVLVIAMLFALAGAWMVLPFAGIEVAALALAFHLVARRDGDFERLTILGGRVVLEASEAGRLSQTEFNLAWAKLVKRATPAGCGLAIRSHGREVAIGRLMSDEERRRWYGELTHRLRGAA